MRVWRGCSVVEATGRAALEEAGPRGMGTQVFPSLPGAEAPAPRVRSTRSPSFLAPTLSPPPTPRFPSCLGSHCHHPGERPRFLSGWQALERQGKLGGGLRVEGPPHVSATACPPEPSSLRATTPLNPQPCTKTHAHLRRLRCSLNHFPAPKAHARTHMAVFTEHQRTVVRKADQELQLKTRRAVRDWDLGPEMCQVHSAQPRHRGSRTEPGPPDPAFAESVNAPKSYSQITLLMLKILPSFDFASFQKAARPALLLCHSMVDTAAPVSAQREMVHSPCSAPVHQPFFFSCICTPVCVHIHACACVCTNMCVPVCVHTCVCLCVYTYMCVPVCVYIHVAA